MYIYRPWHLLGPLAFIMTAFYLGQHFPVTYDVIATQIACWYFGGLLFTGMMVNWSMYQAYLTGMPAGKKPAQQPEVIAPIKDDGKLIGSIALGQTVTALPVIDCERRFARTLIDMRNSNLEVNMKESYWIAGKRYGESREAFVDMLENWERNHVCARAGENKNSTYTIIDWRKVRLVADGHALPPPPM